MIFTLNVNKMVRRSVLLARGSKHYCRYFVPLVLIRLSRYTYIVETQILQYKILHYIFYCILHRIIFSSRCFEQYESRTRFAFVKRGIPSRRKLISFLRVRECCAFRKVFFAEHSLTQWKQQCHVLVERRTEN